MPGSDLPKQIQVARCCASCNYYGPHSSSRGVCGLAQGETVLCIWSCERWEQRERRLPWPMHHLKPPAPGTLSWKIWKKAYNSAYYHHKEGVETGFMEKRLADLGLPSLTDTLPLRTTTEELPATWRRLVPLHDRQHELWQPWQLQDKLRLGCIRLVKDLAPEISRAMREWKAVYLLDHPPPPKVIQDHSREHNPLDRFSDLA